jgi:3-deoxy-7-phosphoheptulonate synthase
MPYSIGFKNGTDGSIQIALDAIQSAQNEHQFLGMNQQGLPSVIQSAGNPLPHLILRGANHGPIMIWLQFRQLEKSTNKTYLP